MGIQLGGKNIARNTVDPKCSEAILHLNPKLFN